MPLLDNPYIKNIVDAFVSVEKYDIRVSKVVLNQDTWDKIQNQDFTTNFVSYPRYLSNCRDQISCGTLWGASVEIGDENKVFGEPGLIPSNFSLNHEEINVLSGEPLPEFGVCIKTGNYEVRNNLELVSAEERHRRMVKWKIKSNLSINIKTRANFYYRYPKSEWVAMETLREMITEQEFRKYLVYGFILVEGQSGKVYQIFRSQDHIKVWEKGNLVEELCVFLSNRQIPPTDKLIAFKTMIEANEKDIKILANVYRVNYPRLKSVACD